MARVRGYADWNPAPESLALIGDVKQILDEYRSFGAMTARQIFYRLVATRGYDKTEQAYNNLCEKLVRARRAQMIPFSAIRDEKIVEHGAGAGYADPAAFWEAVRNDGQYYGRPTRQGQDYRIELWCETVGMSEMVAGMTREFGVPVYSAGGFLSVTATHAIAMRADQSSRQTIALHVGDFDPSGVSIFESIRSDARSFYASHNGGGNLSDFDDQFQAIRVALTEDQVEEHGIETAPPKRSDSRSKKWEEEGNIGTAQLEAIDPPLLQSMIETAIEEWTDLDLLREVEAESDEERDEIIDELQRLIDGRDAE